MLRNPFFELPRHFPGKVEPNIGHLLVPRRARFLVLPDFDILRSVENRIRVVDLLFDHLESFSGDMRGRFGVFSAVGVERVEADLGIKILLFYVFEAVVERVSFWRDVVFVGARVLGFLDVREGWQVLKGIILGIEAIGGLGKFFADVFGLLFEELLPLGLVRGRADEPEPAVFRRYFSGDPAIYFRARENGADQVSLVGLLGLRFSQAGVELSLAHFCLS